MQLFARLAATSAMLTRRARPPATPRPQANHSSLLRRVTAMAMAMAMATALRLVGRIAPQSIEVSRHSCTGPSTRRRTVAACPSACLRCDGTD